MDEINCIVCEKPIKFPSYIDPDDFDGNIFYHKCNLLLYLKLKSAKVKKYKVVDKQKINIQSKPPKIVFKPAIPRPNRPEEK